MKLILSVQFWKDSRLHEMTVLGPVTIDQLSQMMEYGGMFGGQVEGVPLDVSEISSLKWILTRVPDTEN